MFFFWKIFQLKKKYFFRSWKKSWLQCRCRKTLSFDWWYFRSDWSTFEWCYRLSKILKSVQKSYQWTSQLDFALHGRSEQRANANHDSTMFGLRASSSHAPATSWSSHVCASSDPTASSATVYAWLTPPLAPRLPPRLCLVLKNQKHFPSLFVNHVTFRNACRWRNHPLEPLCPLARWRQGWRRPYATTLKKCPDLGQTN